MAGFAAGLQSERYEVLLSQAAFPEFLARPAYAWEDSGKLAPTETYLAVLDVIRTDYASQTPGGKAPDLTRVTYAAIDGMLETLHDRYTEF